MSIDLSAWLTKAETARRLGISERTLDRLVAQGKGPECRNRPRPPKRPEPVYRPEDVDALVAAAASRPAVIGADSPIGATVSSESRALARPGEIPPGLSAALQFVERLVSIADRRREQIPGATAPPTLWMTLKQAVAYTGLSERFLRRLVKVKALPSIRDRATKVRRTDLDNLASSDTVAALAEYWEGPDGERE